MRPRSSSARRSRHRGDRVTGLSLWRAARSPALLRRRERLRPPQSVRRRNHALTRARQAPIAIGAAGDIACERSDPNGSTPTACQYDDTADLSRRPRRACSCSATASTRAGGLDDVPALLRPDVGQVPRANVPASRQPRVHAGPALHPRRGYFRYFGDRVRGPDGLGYYSFDLPTGCTPGSGCAGTSSRCPPSSASPAADAVRRPIRSDPGPGQPDVRVARARPPRRTPTTSTRARSRSGITRCSRSPTGAARRRATRPLWELLYDAHADVVLNGHSHNYQRWAAPGSVRRARPGARHPTSSWWAPGGASKYGLLPDAGSTNLAAAQNDAFGIVRITLHRAGYSWRWVPAAGQPSRLHGRRDVGVRVRVTAGRRRDHGGNVLSPVTKNSVPMSTPDAAATGRTFGARCRAASGINSGNAARRNRGTRHRVRREDRQAPSRPRRTRSRTPGTRHRMRSQKPIAETADDDREHATKNVSRASPR